MTESRFVPVVLVALFCLLCGPVLAQDVELPWLVVHDNNGNSLPVIGFGGSSATLYVRVTDPVNNVPVPLSVNRMGGGTANDLKGLYNDTYFSQASCAGAAYQKTFGEATDNIGHPGLTGFGHSVAPCNGTGGNQCLYAGSIAIAANANPDPLASRWSNGSCTDADYTGTSNLRAVTSVLDLTVAHPAPYTMP